MLKFLFAIFCLCLLVCVAGLCGAAYMPMVCHPVGNGSGVTDCDYHGLYAFLTLILFFGVGAGFFAWYKK